jgi:hypothetical protein
MDDKNKISLESIDKALEKVNEHWKSKIPVRRISFETDGEYLYEGESFIMQTRDEEDYVAISFEEIKALIDNDEDYIGCNGNCTRCLTPIC